MYAWKDMEEKEFLMEVILWALAINHITMFVECHHFKAFNGKALSSFQTMLCDAYNNNV